MPIIHAYCIDCNTSRYRSKKNFGPTDKPTAADFEPIPPQQVATNPEAPPTCVECGGALKFVTEENVLKLTAPQTGRPLPSREEMAALRTRQEQLGVAPSPVGVETLFAVSGDEVIRDMRETPEGFVFVTNKRVVRIKI